MSTKWVKGEYDRSCKQHNEHWRVRDIQQDRLAEVLKKVAELEKENEELRAKLTVLHRKQFKANRKKDKKDEPNKKPGVQKKNRKRGAPKGHPGWFRRKPDHVDRTIEVSAPTECPHCNCSNLTPVKENREHLQEDIVLQPRTLVTNFKHEQAFCSQCRRTVIKQAEGELLNCHIGPVTKATAVYLRYGLRIPYRKVQELFEVLFNMPFVPASAMAFDRTATYKGEPLYDDLKEKVRAAASIHADETSWRQDGIGHYAWYVGNDNLALFHIDRHRSTEVAQSILGMKFDGVLNTDGYAAYNGVNARERQSCLAHLIRRAEEIKKEILLQKPRFRDHEAIRFCEGIAKLFRKACEINQIKFQEHDQPKLTDDFEKRLYSILHTICITPLTNKNAESFRNRLLNPRKEYDRLFTFLKYPDVQPTNNQAEQSIRNLVIFRKICFGTRSADGSRTHSVMPSLILTAQRQKVHPLKFLQSLFTAETAVAQKVLFNSST
jgi:transposase